MWIEFGDGLICLGTNYIIRRPNKYTNNFQIRYVKRITDDDEIIIDCEVFPNESEAQKRYEEIKKMLVSSQNLITEKLDEIIEDINYWGKEIEGIRR